MESLIGKKVGNVITQQNNNKNRSDDKDVLRKRIERVLAQIDVYAEEKRTLAERDQGSSSYFKFIGLQGGAHVARDLIFSEFVELWLAEESGE